MAAMKWVITTAPRIAATRGMLNLMIEPDPARPAPALRVAVESEETKRAFASVPLTATNADAVAVMIAQAIAAALDIREDIGLTEDEGFIRVRVLQAETLGRFDPLVAAFCDAYAKRTDEALIRHDEDPSEGAQ